MPNAFAYIVLFSWPIAALALFRAMPPSKALIWTVLAGFLFLPSEVGIKIPMIPAFDKSLIPSLTALILCLIYGARNRHVARGAATWKGRPKKYIVAQNHENAGGSTAENALRKSMHLPLTVTLLAILFATPFLSVENNPEPIIAGPRFIKGLEIYDAASMISFLAASLIPFFLGWRYLNTEDAHRQFLSAFVIAGLAYSFPILIEVRLSPQLHNWIYGFFPHDFLQHIREGGFRPIVFLGHGLMVGILLCITILAALALWREDRRGGRGALKWILAAFWLTIILLLSRNFGALCIAAALGPIVMFAGRRLQMAAAASVAVVVLVYPMLRGAGYVPVDFIYEMAQSISEDRAGSLKFRLDNEDALLARALEKPLSGWGNWGRNQIYNPEDGRMTSVTDGLWVILIGMYGWLGYIAHFGLLTLPILFSAFRRRDFGPSLITPGLIIVLCAALIDLIPNGWLMPYVWMLAGSLTGFLLRAESGAANRIPPTLLKNKLQEPRVKYFGDCRLDKPTPHR